MRLGNRPACAAGAAARFLDDVGVVREAYAPQLKWFLEQRAGYALTVDGACETGTSVVFVAADGQTNLTLFSLKIPSESVEDIKAFLQECVRLFGFPLATLRDLSENIGTARDAVLKGVPDFICHYHLLANIWASCS